MELVEQTLNYELVRAINLVVNVLLAWQSGRLLVFLYNVAEWHSKDISTVLFFLFTSIFLVSLFGLGLVIFQVLGISWLGVHLIVSILISTSMASLFIL